MKNRFLLITIICTLAFNIRVEAKEFEQPTKIRCTCYTSTEGSITASGESVREGILAGKRSWMGCVAVLYDMNMNIIGYYEFKDTGAGIDTDGDGKGDSIKKGKSIDVYRDTLDRCHEWIGTFGDYVYLQIIEDVQG